MMMVWWTKAHAKDALSPKQKPSQANHDSQASNSNNSDVSIDLGSTRNNRLLHNKYLQLVVGKAATTYYSYA